MHLPYIRMGVNYLLEKSFEKFKDSKIVHWFGLPLEGSDNKVENNIKMVNFSVQQDSNLSGNSLTNSSLDMQIESQLSKINNLLEVNKKLEMDLKELQKTSSDKIFQTKMEQYTKHISIEFHRRDKVTENNFHVFLTRGEKEKFQAEHLINLLEWRNGNLNQLVSLDIKDPNYNKKFFDGQVANFNEAFKFYNRMDEYTYKVMKEKVEKGKLEQVILDNYNKNIRVENDKAISDYKKWSKEFKSDMAKLVNKSNK